MLSLNITLELEVSGAESVFRIDARAACEFGEEKQRVAEGGFKFGQSVAIGGR